MVPFAYTEFIDGLTTKVTNNIIPMSRIDDAVYRILRVKFTMGLFENPYADPSLAGELGKQVSSKIPRFISLNLHPSTIVFLLIISLPLLGTPRTGSGSRQEIIGFA